MPSSPCARLVLVSLFAAAPATAQGRIRPDSATAIEGMTVTATREVASILAAPLAITKITAPDLRDVSGYGLEDALARVPGVIAQSRYGTSDVRLIIRGFGARGAGDRSNAGTSRGVRVLLDGIPETEPDGRTAFDHIDLAAAEAVEVIRSNASSIWGNAAGGVVNVLTVPSATAPALEVQPIFGSFGLQRWAVRAARPLGEGTAYASFTNSSFDGWRAHSSARRSVLNAGVVGVVGAATRLGVYAAGANNLMHIPGPLTPSQLAADPRQANAVYASRDERRYNKTLRLGATIDHDARAHTSLSAMVFANPKYLQRSERGTYRDFTRYHLGGSVVGRTEFSTGGVRSRLAIGADEAYQDGAILFYTLTPQGTRGTTLTDNKGEGANNVGIFAQDELQLTDRLSVLLGARYDLLSYYYQSFLPAPPVRRDSRSFSRLTPKLGVTWLLGATRSVYANVGGGVEIPAGNETDPLPGQPPALLNPLLEPIRSTTFEVGFKSMSGADTRARGTTVDYDLALYDTEVSNEIIPYNGGRYYQTVGRARRTGAELGLRAASSAGPFGGLALTLSRNRYLEYVVDSTLLGRPPGTQADYGDNEIVGIPGVLANLELGTALPFAPALRIKGAVEHSGAYFADDANAVKVPGFTIVNLTAELRRPITAANRWTVRGFVTLHNVADRRYVGSAFLNPDRVNGEPAVFEPGAPRSVIVSLSVGR
jgi:iron complex outermembrane receptor protein